MKKIVFTSEIEKEILEKHNNGQSCWQISKDYDVSSNTINRLLQSKFNIDFNTHAQIGDIVNGWEITSIYSERLGN